MAAAAHLVRFAQSPKSVEDQVEPEVERVWAVVPEPGEMLLAMLGEIGVVGPQFLEQSCGDVCELLPSGDVPRRGRVAELPEGEAEDVAVERVIRVVRQLGREAAAA